MMYPALFVLYTTDYRSEEEINLLIKIAEDTFLSSVIQEDDSSYGDAVELVGWCEKEFPGAGRDHNQRTRHRF